MAKPLPLPEGDEYVRAARSRLHGRGLFAALDIPKGSYIMEYTGKKVPRKEGDRRAEKQWKKGRIYVFRLNKSFDIDGLQRRNKARLANHSCDPNAESQNERGRRIWVVATRNIEKGEEITYDYHLGFEEDPAECHCGSPKCIGYMVGPDGHKELYDWLVAEGKPVPPNLEKRVGKRRRRKAGKATAQGGSTAGKARKRASTAGKGRTQSGSTAGKGRKRASTRAKGRKQSQSANGGAKGAKASKTRKRSKASTTKAGGARKSTKRSKASTKTGGARKSTKRTAGNGARKASGKGGGARAVAKRSKPATAKKAAAARRRA